MKIGENGGENTTFTTDRQPSTIAGLPNIDQPEAKTDLIASDILSQLRDEHSANFYRLVAAKIPEHVIRETLSEIKQDSSVKSAPRLFTARMNTYARSRLE